MKVEAFVDDNPNINECYGRPVLHDATGLSPMIVSIGIYKIRKMVVEKLVAANRNIEFATAIHASAIVSLAAKIGKGKVVIARTVINAEANRGKHCIVNTGASIDHECIIEDYCHIAPGVNISGASHIGEGTWVGVSTCVIQGINIGKNCFIGAGSVVVRDIPDGMVAYGNPCKVIRENL